MTEEKINSVLEGCDHDSPSKIHYAPIEIFIPENALVLRVREVKLFLYGRFNNFEYSESKILKPLGKSKGWNLRDENASNPGWLGWVFEMPRSITTHDGRLYLNEVFYEPKWEYYFPLVPTILQDCSDFFSGRKSRDELAAIVRRAF
ncbi:MAG: hypothetical protein ABH840_01955 [Nanoarchaeota archaeon]